MSDGDDAGEAAGPGPQDQTRADRRGPGRIAGCFDSRHASGDGCFVGGAGSVGNKNLNFKFKNSNLNSSFSFISYPSANKLSIPVPSPAPQDPEWALPQRTSPPA